MNTPVKSLKLKGVGKNTNDNVTVGASLVGAQEGVRPKDNKKSLYNAVFSRLRVIENFSYATAIMTVGVILGLGLLAQGLAQNNNYLARIVGLPESRLAKIEKVGSEAKNLSPPKKLTFLEGLGSLFNPFVEESGEEGEPSFLALMDEKISNIEKEIEGNDEGDFSSLQMKGGVSDASEETEGSENKNNANDNSSNPSPFGYLPTGQAGSPSSEGEKNTNAQSDTTETQSIHLEADNDGKDELKSGSTLKIKGGEGIKTSLENNVITISSTGVSQSVTTYIASTIDDDSHNHTATTLPANVSYLGQTISSDEILNSTINSNNLKNSNTPTNGQVLSYNEVTGGFTWISPSGTGTVTQINTGNGLLGGPISVTGNIQINAPTCTATEKLSWNGTAFICSTDIDTDTDTDTDTNNYPTSVAVTGTTTKTITLQRQGLADLTAQFTDIDTDTNTTYTAGTGLDLTGTTFSVASTYDDNFLTTSSIFSGDVSGSYNSIAVANDSHSHTATTIPSHDSLTGAGTVDTTLEVQGVSVSGDASGTVGNITVTDNSHSHDTSTISGVDISSDTNLSGDSEIVLTGDALSIASGITRDTELSSFITDGNTGWDNSYGYITASSSDAFTNKTGNISQWTNDSGYITGSSSSALTNKTGNISQWTNDSAYITDGNTNWNNSYGFITASSADALTNKTGNISQWTNDSNYITDGNTNWNNSYGFITEGNDGWDNTYGFITDGNTGWTNEYNLITLSSLTNTALGLTYNNLTGQTSLTTGYVIPTTTEESNWNTAHGWGNHSMAGYITDGNTGWNNSYGFITEGNDGWDNTYGFITASSADALTNKTGNVSMWTNDSGYITGSSSSALTNKTGNVSQWTNDSNYITDGNTNWNNSYGFITEGNDGWDNTYGFITDGNTGWDNSYGYITSVDFSQINNGTGVYLNYKPNNTACGLNQVLKYDNVNNRWACGDDIDTDTDTDTNNYPTSVAVTGTTTKTITLQRQGLADLTAQFTDIDTDTDTNTTYTAGTGLDLIGTTFSVASTYDDNFLTTSSSFGGDVSGTYGAIAVANDSHSHTASTLPSHDSLTGAGTIDTTLEVQGVAVSGDASGTVGNINVTDNSHSHDTSTISGVDISSDTNLSGDSEIVLTGDALSIASGITRDTELSSFITDGNTGWDNTYGFITDGNTGWDNTYGFITASSSDAFTNKTGNISMWTNDANFITLTSLSSGATGLTYTNTTGAFSLTSGYVIPTTTQASNWSTAYTARVDTWNYPLSISSNAVSLGYNTTNLKLTTNQLNTIQDIATTSTPTFGSLTLNGTLALGANSLTTTNTTVVSNLNADYLDGQHGSYYAPLGNISGTTNYISKFTGTNAVGNSLLFDNGTGVGIGTTSPLGVLHISTESSPPMYYDRYGNAPATIIFRRANGTAASPTSVVTDNQLFALGGRGYGATGFSSSGRVALFAAAAEDWTDTAQGGYLAFNTTQNGTVSPLERLRIADTGNVGIGTTNPGQQLELTKSLKLAVTTASDTGVIYKGTNRFIHDFTPSGADGYNTFMGVNAGNFTMTAPSSYNSSYNTGVGNGALASLTTGYFDSAFGQGALGSNATGAYNTAVGKSALAQANNHENTAVGAGALNWGDSYRNTAIGNNAGMYSNGGSSNIYIGRSAGSGSSSTSNPNYNVFVGAFSGYSITTASNNTALGYQAGYTNATGAGNVFLGYNAGYYETGSNKLFIDNQQRASEADARTKALLYGVFDATVANQSLTVNGALNVTGATTFTGNLLPSVNDTYNLGSDTMRWANAWLGAETLHVGTADADEGEIGYTTSSNVMTVQSNGNLALQASSGNVGIGTTSPVDKLTVSQNTKNVTVLKAIVDTDLSSAVSEPQTVLELRVRDSVGATDLNHSASIVFGSDHNINGNRNIASITAGGTTAGYLSFGTLISGNTTEKMRITTDGNVGIGTAAPGTKLEVRDAATGSRVATFSKTTSNAMDAGNILIGTWDNSDTSNSSIHFQHSEASGTGRRLGTIGFRATAAGGNGSFFIANSASNQVPVENLTVTSTGNVGIGKINPGQKLTVAGVIGNMSSDGINGPFWTAKTTNSNSYYGGISIQSLMNSVFTQTFMSDGLGGTTIGPNPSEQIYGLATLGVYNAIPSTGATKLLVQGGAAAADATTNQLFRVNQGGGTTGVFVVQGNGNVGIGTTAPGGKLYVVDTQTVTSGSPYTNYIRSDWNPSSSSSATSSASVIDYRTAGSNNLTSTTGVSGQYIGFSGYGSGTVTRLNGQRIYLDAYNTPVTSAYALYIDPLTASGTGSIGTKYGIYQAGTGDNNYFAGSVGVGVTNPASRLSVRDAGYDNLAISRISATSTNMNMTGGVSLFSESSSWANPFTTTFTSPAFSVSSGNGIDPDFQGYIGSTRTANGGLSITGISDGTNYNAVDISGFLGNASPTKAAINLYGGKLSGASSAALASTEKLLAVSNHGSNVLTVSGGGTTYIAGNVGIGTTSPHGNLDIYGGSSYNWYFGNSNELNFAYDTNAASGWWINYRGYQNGYSQFRNLIIGDGKTNAIMTVNGAAGGVGIGTTDPGTYKLNVAGTTYLGGATTTAGNLLPSANDTYDLGSDSYRFANLWLGAETLHVGTADADEGEIGYTTSSNVMTVQSNGNLALQASSGNVGIGTTSPGTKFNVLDSTSINGEFRVSSSSLSSIGGVNIDTWANNLSTTPFQMSSIRTGLPYGGATNQRTTMEFSTLNGSGSLGERMRIDQYGNIGIGATAPNTALEVLRSNSAQTETRITNANTDGYENRITLYRDAGVFAYLGLNRNNGYLTLSNAYSGPVLFKTGDAEKMRLSAAGGLSLGATYAGTDPGAGNMIVQGNVGIGTTGPGSKLDVYSAANPAGVADPVLRLQAYTDTAGEGPSIDFISNWTATYPNWRVARIAGVYDSSASNGGALAFYTQSGPNADASATEKVRIKPNGNVGIGTTAPGAKLDVMGSIRAYDQTAITGISTLTVKAGAGQGSNYLLNVLSNNSSSSLDKLLTVDASGTVAGWIAGQGSEAYEMRVHNSNAWNGGVAFATNNNGTMTEAMRIGNTGWVSMASTLTVSGAGASSIAGNVGIGTTGPSMKLHVISSNSGDVVGSFIAGAADNTGKTGKIQIGGNATSYYGAVNIVGGHTTDGTAGNSFMAFETRNAGNYTEWMRILNSGNVGIGTTSPGAKLDTLGSTNSWLGSFRDGTNGILLQTYSGLAGILGYNTGASAYNPIELRAQTGTQLYLSTSGNVGIGTTAPVGLLHVKTPASTLSATGGTITSSGGYTVHTFTSNGTFTPTSGSGRVEVLVVAGGGSGGGAGGGGGGGVIYTSYTVSNGQAVPVTVGAGGATKSGNGIGNNGANSVFGSLTAIGGGGGGSYNNAQPGNSGGSGGGGGACNTFSPGLGTNGQGNSGGNGSTTCSPYTSGGGGGAGTSGGSASGNLSGNGGNGMQSNIDGNNYYYGGGGGGGSQTSGQISGNGGLGGGGGGANYSSGTAGTGGGSARNSGGNGQQTNSYPPCDGGAGGANTGGGGGGMGISVSNGGAGGSGIVIVRYITTGTASDALVVNSSGNVGIGTTNPSFQLQLSANSAAKPGGGSWADSSDSRLKKDVTPVTDATSKIMSLNPVQYKWINPTEHGNQTGVQGGFIAQELKQIFPNWVNEIDPQGKDKELIQGGKAMAIQLPFEFDALLVQGLKEINIKVEALTTEVESEKLKVERLAVDVESEKLKVIGLDTRLASVETTTEANSTSIEELERRLAEIEQMEVGAGLVPAQDETEGSEPLEPSASEPLPPSEDSPSSEGEKIDGLIALSLSDQLQGEVIANLNVKNLTVVENVIVAGDLKVEGHIVAGEDTAGELIIEPGVYETQKDPITGLDILDDFGQPMLKLDEFGQKIPVLYKKIEFKKPYTGTPVIGLTPIGEVGLNPEFRYAITEKSQFGFTVKINRAFTTDVKFDWQVMERGEIRN